MHVQLYNFWLLLKKGNTQEVQKICQGMVNLELKAEKIKNKFIKINVQIICQLTNKKYVYTK